MHFPVCTVSLYFLSCAQLHKTTYWTRRDNVIPDTELSPQTNRKADDLSTVPTEDSDKATDVTSVSIATISGSTDTVTGDPMAEKKHHFVDPNMLRDTGDQPSKRPCISYQFYITFCCAV